MQQLRNYYYRFGELILQNYILNANDLHEENVIAYGEYPIVIDAETILDNHIELSKQNSREIINEKIRDSVLFSGLLPNYRFSNKGKGIDMSAIMGKEGDEYPILIPRIAEIGTSNMHYEYVHPIKTANNNLATLNGKFIAPATFIKEIDQGFRDAYRFIMEHKQSTIEKMKIFENIIVRHLIQDTQRYSMILHTSYHPDFLQDGKDRELVLCSIMGHIDEVEKSNKVAELEIKDMLHMDVPYFYINTSCNSLFGTDNKEISNYFETSSICKVKEKICGMTIGAMEEQSRFLKIALTDLNDYKITRKNGNIIRNNISGTFDMRRKQDAIERLAENLLHDAVITPDKHDVNWIGVSSVGSDENSTWQIQPLGNYLYEGLAGIAIFFHALCQSLKIEKYKFVCDALDQNLFTYTKEMEQKVEGIENESSGILCGEAALVYTYEILYQITKHKIYLEYARRHCEILKKTIDNDMYYDLVYGNAGAILALLNLYDLTGEEEYLRIADLAGEKLFASQQFEENTRKGWLGAGSKYPLAGFSHGVAGIAYSLVNEYLIKDKLGLSDTQFKGYKLYRPDEKVIEDMLSYVESFWTSFIDNITVIKEYLSEDEKPALRYRNDKGGNLLFRPIGILEFVKAAVIISKRQNKPFGDVLKEMNKIQLELDSSAWRGVVWDGKKIINRANLNLVRLMIMNLVQDFELSDKEKEQLKDLFISATNFEGDTDSVWDKIMEIKKASSTNTSI